MKQLTDKPADPVIVEARVDEVLMPGQMSQAEVQQSKERAAREALRFQGAAVRVIFRGLGPMDDWFASYD
jgi:hypothetical protein